MKKKCWGPGTRDCVIENLLDHTYSYETRSKGGTCTCENHQKRILEEAIAVMICIFSVVENAKGVA